MVSKVLDWVTLACGQLRAAIKFQQQLYCKRNAQNLETSLSVVPEESPIGVSHFAFSNAETSPALIIEGQQAERPNAGILSAD